MRVEWFWEVRVFAQGLGLGLGGDSDSWEDFEIQVCTKWLQRPKLSRVA